MKKFKMFLTVLFAAIMANFNLLGQQLKASFSPTFAFDTGGGIPTNPFIGGDNNDAKIKARAATANFLAFTGLGGKRNWNFLHRKSNNNFKEDDIVVEEQEEKEANTTQDDAG